MENTTFERIRRLISVKKAVGWSFLVPADDVEEYENTNETGRYHVETNETFAL